MAKKERKNYSLDMGTVSKFQEVCKKRGLEYSTAVEQLMEHYIAQDGQILMDDIYAPRIDQLVKRTISHEVDRLAKMLYNINVDVTAALYSVPAMYKKNLVSVERTFENYINDQLLDPSRKSLGQEFGPKDSEDMLFKVRQFARNDIATRSKKTASN